MTPAGGTCPSCGDVDDQHAVARADQLELPLPAARWGAEASARAVAARRRAETVTPVQTTSEARAPAHPHARPGPLTNPKEIRRERSYGRE